MKNVLLLGSQSYSRQKLLREAQIPFVVVEQKADERACDWGVSFYQLLTDIAVRKMDHVILPDGDSDNDRCYVLTADTMGQDPDGTVHGKPSDMEEAIQKIRGLNNGGEVATGFCIDRKRFFDRQWIVEERVIQVVSARYEFYISDEDIERYMKAFPQYLSVSGGMSIEGYGAQFLKRVDGSYTTILGLPMFEVRKVLEKLGFFDEVIPGS